MKTAINLKQWIGKNRSLLKPPVGNKVVWSDADTIVKRFYDDVDNRTCKKCGHIMTPPGKAG